MKALLARESEGAKTLRYDIIIFRCKCHGRKPVGIYLVMAKNDKTKDAKGVSAFLIGKGTPGFEFGKKEKNLGYGLPRSAS